jgi:hypothetical protein
VSTKKTEITKNKKISFHIGLRTYDPIAYHTAAPLISAADDARAMYNLADRLGYTPLDLKPRGQWDGIAAAPPNVLIDKAAKYDAVAGCFQKTATLLNNEGDKCLITFSGHGTQFANNDPMPNDDGPFDEAICVYDYALLDDVLYGLLEGFAKGVDVVLVLDSCHSGATSPNPGAIVEGKKIVPPNAFLLTRLAAASSFGIAKVTRKPVTAPPPLAVRLQQQFNDFNRLALNANVAAFEACGDDQNTFDGKNPGDLSVYTKKFVAAANAGITAIGALAAAIAAAEPHIDNCTPRLQRAGEESFLKTKLRPA